VDPKVLILVAVIFAATVIAVLAVMHLKEKFFKSDGSKYKCVHCKGKYNVSEKDDYFGSDLCITCGKYLIEKRGKQQ